VVVSVRDFGPGVAREHQARVFEPFYRGGNELVRGAPGAGIGLALVKDLGERMGAAVSGQNDKDGGYSVRLVFEAAPAAGSTG
jgi:two-component system sensor histidine kinase MprB